MARVCSRPVSKTAPIGSLELRAGLDVQLFSLTAYGARPLTAAAQHWLKNIPADHHLRFEGAVAAIARGLWGPAKLTEYLLTLRAPASSTPDTVGELHSLLEAAAFAHRSDLFMQVTAWLRTAPPTKTWSSPAGASYGYVLGSEFIDDTAISSWWPQYENSHATATALIHAATSQRRLAIMQHATQAARTPDYWDWLAEVDAVFETFLDGTANRAVPAERVRDAARTVLDMANAVRVVCELATNYDVLAITPDGVVVSAPTRAESVGVVRSELAKVFQDVCGDDVRRWEMMLSLAPRHTGTLGDLVRAVNSLAPAV